MREISCRTNELFSVGRYELLLGRRSPSDELASLREPIEPPSNWRSEVCAGRAIQYDAVTSGASASTRARSSVHIARVSRWTRRMLTDAVARTTQTRSQVFEGEWAESGTQQQRGPGVSHPVKW